MRDQLVVQAQEQRDDRAIDHELVGDGVRQVRTRDAKELDIGAGEEVAGSVTQYEEAEDRRNGLGGGSHHLAGGQPLFVRPVVRFKCLGRDCGREVVLLEGTPVQVCQGCSSDRFEVVGGIAVKALLGQDSLVLGGGEAPPRTYTNADSASVSNRRRVRRFDAEDGNPRLGQRSGRDRDRGWRHDVAIALHIGELRNNSSVIGNPVGLPASVTPTKITPGGRWSGTSFAKAQTASRTAVGASPLNDSFRSTRSDSPPASNRSSSVSE